MSGDPPDPGEGEGGDEEPTDDEPSGGDPFADMDVDGREGDPFEGLGEPDGESGDRRSADDSRGSGRPEGSPESNRGLDDGAADSPAEWSSLDDQPPDPSSRDGDAADGDAADADAGGRGDAGHEAEPGEFFESGAGGGDGWPSDAATDADDTFDAGEPRGDPFEGGDDLFERRDAGGVDPDEVWESLREAEDAGSVAGAETGYAEVSKHSYCERCQWFSEPPDVACSHEGTEIVEFLDMETVLVLNCPVVAERRELEESS